ncbi:MAG: exodeoxyribonuclease V subunit gamma [Candidatus Contendobacter sp.]|jgi:exodeoxyribonuclease V gamma subunit|nr:exodeoxyribonuclease V subunit gamma [Gammaproteobacteria bacterium]MCC8993869.1 exodeoxyribonuclease V subunit gamma [Candidatus Contendobacter sp.]
MFHVHQSNRLEILTDRLAELLRQPLRSPLAQEIIITQSNGMARWLALRLADRLGVCANLSFQFPATFLWEMSRAVLRYLPPTSAFEKPILTWRLMALLRDMEDTPRFAEPRAYLGSGDDDFRRYELAVRLADCFDQYLIYRPDWIEKWEAGEDDHWQSELWRRLGQGGEAHRVQVQHRFRTVLDHGEVNRRRLPERVAILGIAALPPLVLELLAGLARHLDVHLFLLNPCQEYWGDILAERDLARLGEEVDPDEAYLTVGNPLLASLGKQGRDFIDALQAYPRAETDDFAEPVGAELLQQVQADILHLRDRGSDDCPPLVLQPTDRSVQVHVCHGPMREVEVLHDQLLALFEANRDLRPSDVMVMAPDIAAYGPLLEAVFDTAPPERRIPFSIADQGLQTENPLVEVFFELLDLGGGRFDAVQVLSLLEPAAVRRRFGLSEDDLGRVRRWVRDTGIRWGIDAEIKSLWQLPATAEHTWRAGLDRLLLGYALPGEGRTLYSGILPYDEVEGGDAQALGGLYGFTETLFGLDARLRERRPLADWVTALHAVLEQFFDPRDREENELQLIRRALETLRANVEHAGLAEPVTLAVIKAALRSQLNVPESGAARFLGGGLTCCAMVPMRSIPFPVVCLIGMNDDAYPRPHRPVSFDRMATKFRRGDRSRRQDDRYLFLETLLSARRCFYLSYVGQNIRDNSVLPPSVLVSEWLDTLDRGFQSADGRRASAQLVVRHPLQAFSRRYFSGDPRRFSYAGEWVAASRQAGRGEQDAVPLLTVALSKPDSALRTVTLDGLIQFFKNPARWLLRERLGVRPEEGEAALATREPFVLGGLERYQLLEEMLELHLERHQAAEIDTIVRAAGALPHGQIGECVFTQAQERVVRFAGRLGRVLPRRAGEPLVVDVPLGEFRLMGQLGGLTPHGWLGYRLAGMKANDYLNLWLHHLALNAVAADGLARHSQWIAEDREVELTPVEGADAHLRALLEMYWQGSQRLTHFFPKSALAYVEALRKDKNQDTDKALRAARQVWEGSAYGDNRAERNDAYYQLAFRGTDPLDEEFVTLALAVFGPLFAQVEPAAAEA